MASTNSNEAPLTSLGVVGNADQDHHPPLPIQQPTPSDEATPTSQPDPRGLVVRAQTATGVPQIDPPHILSEAERPASELVEILTAPDKVDDSKDSTKKDKAPLPICSNDVLVKTLLRVMDSEQPPASVHSKQGLGHNSNIYRDIYQKLHEWLHQITFTKLWYSMNRYVKAEFLFLRVRQLLEWMDCPGIDPSLRIAAAQWFGEMIGLDREAEFRIFREKINVFEELSLKEISGVWVVELKGFAKIFKERWEDLTRFFNIIRPKLEGESNNDNKKKEHPRLPFQVFFVYLADWVSDVEKAARLKNYGIDPQRLANSGLLSLLIHEQAKAFDVLHQQQTLDITDLHWWDNVQEMLASWPAPGSTQPFEVLAVFDYGIVEAPQVRHIGRDPKSPTMWIGEDVDSSAESKIDQAAELPLRVCRDILRVEKFLRKHHGIVLQGTFPILGLSQEMFIQFVGDNYSGYTKRCQWWWQGHIRNDVLWVALNKSVLRCPLKVPYIPFFWVLRHELGHVALTILLPVHLFVGVFTLLDEAFAERVAEECTRASLLCWHSANGSICSELPPPTGTFRVGYATTLQEWQPGNGSVCLEIQPPMVVAGKATLSRICFLLKKNGHCGPGGFVMLLTIAEQLHPSRFNETQFEKSDLELFQKHNQHAQL